MANDSHYYIPLKTVEVTTVIKRSRFITRISHAANAEHAFKLIEQNRQEYPDARHHCWAFIACPPTASTAIRFSDAGEPAGTAGKPILNSLQHSHYGEIICLVSRYFGGIKLGSGGLARAYSGSTQAALKKLPVIEKVNLIPLKIEIPYAFESDIRYYLNSVKAVIHQVDYQHKVIVEFEIAPECINKMKLFCNNKCKGDMIIYEQTHV